MHFVTQAASSRPCKLAVLFLLALALAVPFTSSAHETRPVEASSGEYKLIVGWFHEPAFVSEPNGVDIHISRASDDRKINTRSGDIVDLTVEVQYRDGEGEDSKILDSFELPHQPTVQVMTYNRYASFFMPTKPGFYAFRIRGTISDASDETETRAGEAKIDQIFYMEKLEEPLTFPKRSQPGE